MKRLQQNKLRACLAAAGIAMSAGLAHADEASGIKYRISGYGTIGAAMADRADLGYHPNMSTSEGAGTRPDLGVDSRLAVQGLIDFNNGFTVTAQLLAKRRAGETYGNDKDFDVGVEWLFAQYAVTPNLDVKLGRVVMPVFLLSDSLAVGYSQPWLRAPQEIYGMYPVTTADGIQAVWRIPLGSSVVTVQPTYGKSKGTLTGYSVATNSGLVLDLDIDPVFGLNVTFEEGPWLARVGQTRGKLPFPFFNPATFMPVTLTMKDTFTSAGLQYDNGSAIVMAEWAKRSQNGQAILGGEPIIGQKSWYLAGGYRFGKWLPMVTYARTTLSSAGRESPSQQSYTAGVRYDLMANVALKGQIARFKDTNSGAFTIPGTSGKGVNIYSFAVDFVF